MKNLKMVKKLLVIVLSLIMVLVYSNMVFAADENDSLFSDFEPVAEEPSSTSSGDTGTTNTGTGTGTSGTGDTTSNSGGSSSSGISNTNNNANNNTNTTNTNTDHANVLADTGLSNTGSIVAVVLVILGISAIYSYKKVSDYRKI